MVNFCLQSEHGLCVCEERDVIYGLTGVEFEEQFDGVVIQMTRVQNDLDKRGQTTLTGCCHRHGARHIQRAEHCEE